MTEPAVLVAGETLIDFIPETAAPLPDVETFHRRAGGAPANVAVGLTRLDERPWLCTALSTDPFGGFLADCLASEGLPGRFITQVDNPTALAFVSHDPDANVRFSFFRERTADTVIETDIVGNATLEAIDWLVVGGVTLSAEPARSATFELVERAQAAGCRIVFDPNTRPELWGESDEMTLTLERLLGRTDVLKSTREDFVPTAIPTDGDFAARLLEKGPSTLLLTEGAGGSTLVADAESPWGEGEWHHPGYDLDEVVDTTGAGDAFLAGAITGLVEEADPEELLAFANAVAAVSTTEGGAMAALPSRQTVDGFLETR